MKPTMGLTATDAELRGAILEALTSANPAAAMAAMWPWLSTRTCRDFTERAVPLVRARSYAALEALVARVGSLELLVERFSHTVRAERADAYVPVSLRGRAAAQWARVVAATRYFLAHLGVTR